MKLSLYAPKPEGNILFDLLQKADGIKIRPTAKVLFKLYSNPDLGYIRIFAGQECIVRSVDAIGVHYEITPNVDGTIAWKETASWEVVQ